MGLAPLNVIFKSLALWKENERYNQAARSNLVDYRNSPRDCILYFLYRLFRGKVLLNEESGY
jgi:hypothetical protein